MQNDAVLNQKR